MNIRLVRNKIKSVGNVKKITRAMQLVSAVKMKKAQERAISGKPYHEVLERVIAQVMSKVDKQVSALVTASETAENKRLIILVTSNKGLCGAFSANLLRYLALNEKDKNADYLIVGRKGGLFANRLRKTILADFSSNNSLNSVTAIAEMAIEAFTAGKYKEVIIYYNKFVSSLRVEPTADRLLPVSIPKEELIIEEEYLIEPKPEEIIDKLLKSYIEEKIRFILIQSEAGEHSARMIAMKNATDNANELIFSLTLIRNKLRQQKITYELLDMITAKESVEVN